MIYMFMRSIIQVPNGVVSLAAARSRFMSRWFKVLSDEIRAKRLLGQSNKAIKGNMVVTVNFIN